MIAVTFRGSVGVSPQTREGRPSRVASILHNGILRDSCLLSLLKEDSKKTKKRSTPIGLERLPPLKVSPGQGAGVAAHRVLHGAESVVQRQLHLTTVRCMKGPVLPLA